MSNPAEHNATRTTDSIQARLTGYACGLKYADLSPDAIASAKARLIDTLGALMAGFHGAPCRIARDLAAQMPYPGGATVIGTGIKCAPDLAAFVNATTARFPELTDTYHWPGSAYGHPSDVITPVLSAAEYARVDGRELITAIVLAYEVFCRLSDVFHNKAFDPGNFACIAIAISAAKLFRLSGEQTSHAIAMAAVPNVILRQVRQNDLTMFKVAAAGQAGRAGVFAAMLARAGMEGPHLPFEGKAGWCDHVALERFTLSELGGGGTAFRIPETRVKNRPCAGNTISSVLAAEKAAPLTGPDDVERIAVEVYSGAKVASGTAPHFWNPQSPETADHSIPYLVAVALLDGTVTPRSYDDAHLWNPRVRALMSKVEVVENTAFTKEYEQVPQVHRTRVIVVMKSGEKRVGESGGDQEDLGAAKSDAQITEKFKGLTEEALGAMRVNGIVARLWKLEELANAAEIPPLFVNG